MKSEEKHNKTTATPDMFYKKGELVDEIENEEIDELIEGEPKKNKNIINIKKIRKSHKMQKTFKTKRNN